MALRGALEEDWRVAAVVRHNQPEEQLLMQVLLFHTPSEQAVWIELNWRDVRLADDEYHLARVMQYRARKALGVSDE